MKMMGCLLSRLGVQITDFGLRVFRPTPIFLAFNVSFRVAKEDIEKMSSFCFSGSRLERKSWE